MGTRLIFRTELPNSQTVWVVSDERPDIFQRWVAEGKRLFNTPGGGPIIRDETAPEALELRAFMNGINPPRWYEVLPRRLRGRGIRLGMCPTIRESA
jgi:hypothetical protein